MAEPASIRYKNPGAMWGSALARKWGARTAVALNDGTGQGNNIAVFPTYVDGICAQLDLWRSSPNYRNKRFADAIRVWSGGNNVESYIAFVLARVPGMTRDTIMNDAFWRGPMGIAFLKAQAWHEAGKRYPAPDADWFQAQRIVFSGVKQSAPKLPPSPDVEPVDKPTKPVSRSTEIWSQLLAIITTVASVVTDIRFLALIVILFGAYQIWKRYERGDLKGWFK